MTKEEIKTKLCMFCDTEATHIIEDTTSYLCWSHYDAYNCGQNNFEHIVSTLEEYRELQKEAQND